MSDQGRGPKSDKPSFPRIDGPSSISSIVNQEKVLEQQRGLEKLRQQMAERFFNQFSYGLEKRPVTIYGAFLGAGNADMVLKKVAHDGTTSAPAGTSYKGMTSCTYNSAAGNFTFKYQDTYTNLLDFNISFLAVDGATAPVATSYYILAVDTSATGGATIKVMFTDVATPSNVSPTSNTVVFVKATFANSSAV